MSEEKEYRCPGCNAIVSKTDKKCPVCGRMLFFDDDYLEVIDRLEKKPKEKEDKKKKAALVPPEHKLAAIAIGMHGFFLLVSIGFVLPVNIYLAIYAMVFGAGSLWAGIATFIGHPKGPISTVIMGIFALLPPNTWILPIILGSLAIAGILIPWLFNVVTRKKV